MDVADIVVVDEELVEDGEDVEEDVEHAEVAEVGVAGEDAGEDADVDEEADTLRTTQHQVMMTLIKEVWMGHLILLLIDNLASISLLDLSQHVKVIFSNFFSLPMSLTQSLSIPTRTLKPTSPQSRLTPTRMVSGHPPQEKKYTACLLSCSTKHSTDFQKSRTTGARNHFLTETTHAL